MPIGLAAVLLITVLGVFYFGIFSDKVIEKFSTIRTCSVKRKLSNLRTIFFSAFRDY